MADRNATGVVQQAAGARSALGRDVGRLLLRSRLNRAASGASTGLFWGLAAGLVAAALAGTVRLPLPGLSVAALAAACGALAGAVAGLLRGLDTRRLLISADRSLGTRELVSTAWELAASPPSGTFSEAVIRDAQSVLSGVTAGKILGAPRMPLLPFVPILVALIAAALVFPVDLGSLFRGRQGSDVLASIGEDLESSGRLLLESARAQNQGRTLALSRELAQLGRELAERRIRNEEAMDRMRDLERRMAAEYQMQLRALPQSIPNGAPGAGPGTGGENGQSRPGANGRAQPGSPGQGAGRDSEKELRDLGKALDSLRDAQKKAAPGKGGAGQGEPPSMADRPGGSPPPGSSRLPPGGGRRPGSDQSQEPGGGSRGPGLDRSSPGDEPSSVPGSAPSPDTHGPASSISRGGEGPALRAETAPSEGDSTKLLVRALPDSTGSRAQEDRTLRRYAQQAESALARDEVPPKLKQYVKEYFTIIGMSAGDGK
jgi:hypothetical protein